MEYEVYEVYVKTNGKYITSVNSSAFIVPSEEWIKIDEGDGDRYHHAQNNYFEKPVYNDNGAYNYKLVDGVAVECTTEEIAEQEGQEPVRVPTLLERIDAQVLYTAMMTDTLLEV